MATAHQYTNISDARNQFSFECPVFEVTTKIAVCFRLRELVWAGVKPEVRKGCQVCMRAGKCPAAAVIATKYPKGKSWQDDYASDKPVLGKLRKDVLQRIARTLVVESYYREFPASDAEKLKIETCQTRIEKMLSSAPAPSNYTPNYDKPTISMSHSERSRPRRSASKPELVNSNTVNQAAETGDLSAAINAA